MERSLYGILIQELRYNLCKVDAPRDRLIGMKKFVQVMTNDMKGSAITAFAVGKNKHHDDVLLAVDRDGKIGKVILIQLTICVPEST